MTTTGTPASVGAGPDEAHGELGPDPGVPLEEDPVVQPLAPAGDRVVRVGLTTARPQVLGVSR
ncbi:hypothetical protein ABC795_06190 [Blastococcus sp. HT6-30]|uniref:hypothetical protein n=1 Tax=Blastococcus sp. HT6-30 TaxID=3144843 RepID=UPI00321AB734